MKALFGFFLLLGVLAALGFFILSKSSPPSVIPVKTQTGQLPTESFSIANPPTESLKGLVSGMKGTIMWESRVATAPATISTLKEVSQGELLNTGKNGAISLVFSNLAAIEEKSNSSLSIVQTLPSNLVFSQSKGDIVYEKNGDSPLSVRVADGVLLVENGRFEVAVDEKKDQVTIDALQGSAKFGFEDENNVSQVFDIKAGKKFLFDGPSKTGDFIGG